MMIALFIDDGLLAERNEDCRIEILNRPNQKFEVIFDTAPNSRLSYLSIQKYNGPNGILVNQPICMKKILKRFKFDLGNTASSPIERWKVTDEDNLVKKTIRKVLISP